MRLVIGLAAGVAQATMINFDDLSPGEVLTNQYPGVTFSNSDGALLAGDDIPGAPFTPPIAIFAENYTVPGNYSLAVFTATVTWSKKKKRPVASNGVG